MPTYRVKVKTTSYDWMTVEVPGGLDTLKTMEHIQRVVDCDDGMERESERAWDSAEPSDGPGDGHSIDYAAEVG